MPERSSADPLLQCDFCGGSPPAVGRIIAGPGRYICDGCVQRAGDGTTMDVVAAGTAAACSFCGRPRAQAERMVVRDDVRICDRCLDLANQILDRDVA